jgi:Transposase IS66 family
LLLLLPSNLARILTEPCSRCNFSAADSPRARELLEDIGRLFAIEAEIKGRSPEERLAVRRQQSALLLANLKARLDATLAQVSGKSSFAKAIRYATSLRQVIERIADHPARRIAELLPWNIG